MNPNENTSTRKNVLLFLKIKGPQSTKELAAHLEITEMAVRRHLQSLELDGLVESRMIRQPMGRPLYQFNLTELADDVFTKNYHTLTLDLLQELADEVDEELVERLFKRRNDKLIHKYQSSLEGKSLHDKVAALTEIQKKNGYMADWEQTTDGDYLIKEHNCPIAQVANEYSYACQCELNLFQTLLNTEVERTECLAKNGNKCAYLIKKEHILT
ncbi:transcriptional regulator [Paenibacillus albiflavus]|uniref:Transcriptional regulator n=2 Tax=Paenibacillus albiflavus TaxID=2545760 RepID=A0A4R4ED65_9BACL|nr:transcriptional regulator [Paenibacillus albiflavus]